MSMRINTFKHSIEYKTAMKLALLLLVAVVAAANAKFEFTEEWELWKKVRHSLNNSLPSTISHFDLYSVGTWKRIFIRRGRALASHHLGGQQEIR